MKTFKQILDALGDKIFDFQSSKPVEETENFIRIRVRDPGDFRDDTFRKVALSASQGIFSIQGKLKANEGEESDPMSIQSLLFDVDKWSKEDALEWARDHDFTPKALEAQQTKFQKKEGHKSFQSEIKVADIEQRIIEGLASTPDVDRDKDIVPPESFKRFVNEVTINPKLLPKMFYAHDSWHSLPVGKLLNLEIRQTGLWFRGQLSKATQLADEVWEQVKEGIQDTFSIGYILHDAINNEHGGLTFKDTELTEISFAPVPSQVHAQLQSFKNKQTITLTQEELEVPEVTVKEPQNLAEMTSLLKTVSEDLSAVKKKLGETENKEIPDEKQFLEKVTPKLTELIDQHFEKKNKERPRVQLFDPKEAGIRSEGNAKMTFEELLQTDIKMPSNDFERKVKEFHTMSDDVLIMDALYRAKYGHRYIGAKSLTFWPRYQALTNELAKALDTATAAEGLEFMPTIFSPELHDLVRVNLKIAAQFPMFPMPSDTWKFPVAGADTVAKKVAETIALTVTPDTLEETPGTANVTFTAVKARGRIAVSSEAVENSIIDLMAFLKNKIAISIARAIETADISGDTTATHQDDDVHTGAGQANDFRRAWKGLRKLAIAGSNTTDFGGAFTIALLRTTRESLGKYGLIPTELFWSCAPKVYFKFIGLTTSAVGPVEQGILRLNNGVVEAFDGIQIIPSGEYPTNLAATGVNTSAGPNTFTAISLCHKPSLAHATRKQTTLEVQRLAVQDQFELISFWRGDFQPFFATAAAVGPTGYGFEI